MYYTVYKITNTLDGKDYIGKHQTTDVEDGYMGSGKYLKRAIEKHGIENFTKEIIHVFDNEQEMNTKEAELVHEEFVGWSNTYNICVGGQGGFSFINEKGLNVDIIQQRKRNPDLQSISSIKGGEGASKMWADPVRSKIIGEKISTSLKIYWKENGHSWSGRKHTDQTKEKMRKSKNVGETNSQYGTIWITNGVDNKKIKKDLDIIPEGWYKGRKLKQV